MSVNLKHAKYYFNREISWLKFNERVLEEAMDESHPLLERLKFISIFSSNLDEFFMIRVAGLKDQIHAGIHETPIDGLAPEVQLRRISRQVHKMATQQAEILNDDILPKLKKKGIRLRNIRALRKSQKEFLDQYFHEDVFPLLTPMAVDPTHPFPQLRGLGLNVLIELRTPYRQDNKLAVLHIPSSLPRFIPLPTENGHFDFILIEDLIRLNISQLFPNYKVLQVSEFRITRNADLDLSEAEADDLLKLIERELRKRRLGTVIRLEVNHEMDPENRAYLKRILQLHDQDIYDLPTYLDLSAFMSFLKLNYPELKDQPFVPALNRRFVKNRSAFKTIAEGDVLLHHPYDSFSHVVDFIQEAALDPDVLAIKQTLYRTSGQSPIVKALKDAVMNGKQVTALIELKARFDEQNNITWAKELDHAGVSVVYGILGLKTHCKICMVVRKEGDRIRRYLHLGTGNYNAATARIYTDLALMTCDSDMGSDASELFNLLTGYSLQDNWKKFFIAPRHLRNNISEEIRTCIANHSEEEPARIMFVINNIVDPDMIQLLYKASMKGIRVDMVVRGICCLKPGIKGVSDNITVKSIVGRFLEHTRIYYFKSKGQSRIFLGSADLMQRNLDRRVELVFPLPDENIKKRVREILQILLDDNVKSRYLDQYGNYTRKALKPDENPFSAQIYFLNESQEKQRLLDTISS
jgi:polyphosphate kinase